MLDTPPPLIVNPALAQKPIAQLQQHLATATPWLSHVYGLVQTGTDKTGKQRYPRVFKQDGSADMIDIRPDQEVPAICFFEHDGPHRIDWDDNMHRSGYMEFPLAAVVWLNLPLIDVRDYDFTEELAQDFLANGLVASPLGGELTPERLEFRRQLVFERYRWNDEDQQYGMLPYSCFRVAFTVRQKHIVACQPQFVPINPPA